MIEIFVRFRSRGMTWRLGQYDTLEIREGDTTLEVRAELVLEILQHYYRAAEIQHHLAAGTAPRKALAPATTRDLLEQRRLARQTRRRA